MWWPLISFCLREANAKVNQCRTCSLSFRLHPRYRKLNLNHLYFADDLMLFSKGDSTLIKLLCDCLEKFAIVSGQHANKSKFAIYATGLPKSLTDVMSIQMDLSLGNMSFRYLGITLISKKIYVVDCDAVIDKMTARFLLWYCKNLSYVARL